MFTIGFMWASSSVGAQFSFADPLVLDAGLNPASITAADFDGDNELDLVVVNSASDDAYVYLGNGLGGFSFSSSFAVGNFPQGIIAADFDGDLDADIATTSVPFNTGNVSAWLGNGDGTFQTPFVNVSDDGPRPVAAVDLDKNMILDLVTTNSGRGNLSVFLGDGDGTFDLELRTPVGPAAAFPTDLAIADFDEDTNLDIITSNAQSADDSLGLLLGDGDGTFQAATAIPTTCNRPESVVAGDFDDDSNMDVAVACFTSSEIAVLLGDGMGGFATPVLYDVNGISSNPYWIMSVDLDNDGEEDLVTSGNSSFAVLGGNGDGTFATAAPTTVIGTLAGAIAEDFDGDSWTDLAFTNFGQDEVMVYLNTTGVATVPALDPSAAILLIGMLSSLGVLAAAARSPRVQPSRALRPPETDCSCESFDSNR